MAKIKASCEKCDTKDSFVDEHDVKKNGWRIFGIKVEANEILLICPKCQKKHYTKKSVI